jgi:hypothetical protein
MSNRARNFWVSGPFAYPLEFPMLVYHATEPARYINSPAEFEALGEGWSKEYIYKAYPKMKFHESGETKVVDTPEDEAALGAGWGDTPPALPDVPPVTLSPTGQSFPTTGGTGTFAVTMTGQGQSNTWTVDFDAVALTWVTVVSPPLHTPQSANGTVSYTVAGNE